MCFLVWGLGMISSTRFTRKLIGAAQKLEQLSRDYTGLSRRYLGYVHRIYTQLEIHFQISSLAMNQIIYITYRLHGQGEVSKEILPCSRKIKQVQSRKIPFGYELLRYKPLQVCLCVE